MLLIKKWENDKEECHDAINIKKSNDFFFNDK